MITALKVEALAEELYAIATEWKRTAEDRYPPWAELDSDFKGLYLNLALQLLDNPPDVLRERVLELEDGAV